MSLALNFNYGNHQHCYYRPNHGPVQNRLGRNCWHGNLENQHVGPNWRRGRFYSCHQQQGNGYVLDFNNNGRYDRGRDGVLVFDFNRDGRYSQNDVRLTNDMMKSARGNYDFNGDGRVCHNEARRGRFLRFRFSRMDRNRDGQLNAHEISRNGGRVWVDHSRGGGISANELHSAFRIPNRFGGSRRINSVSPYWGSGTSQNGAWWNNGCGGHRPFQLKPWFKPGSRILSYSYQGC